MGCCGGEAREQRKLAVAETPSSSQLLKAAAIPNLSLSIIQTPQQPTTTYLLTVDQPNPQWNSRVIFFFS